MKALSIHQPWAWLILHAGKDIENRQWRTPFRGRILLHASKAMTEEELENAEDVAHEIAPAIVLPAFYELERGGIIGSVEIVDCVDRSDSPWFFGPWGFVLRAPEILPFRPMRGALGLFEVE